MTFTITNLLLQFVFKWVSELSCLKISHFWISNIIALLLISPQNNCGFIEREDLKKFSFVFDAFIGNRALLVPGVKVHFTAVKNLVSIYMYSMCKNARIHLMKHFVYLIKNIYIFVPKMLVMSGKRMCGWFESGTGRNRRHWQYGVWRCSYNSPSRCE